MKSDLIAVRIVGMTVGIVTIVTNTAPEMIGVMTMTIATIVDLNIVAQGVSGSVNVSGIGIGNESDRRRREKRLG